MIFMQFWLALFSVRLKTRFKIYDFSGDTQTKKLKQFFTVRCSTVLETDFLSFFFRFFRPLKGNKKLLLLASHKEMAELNSKLVNKNFFSLFCDKIYGF